MSVTIEDILDRYVRAYLTFYESRQSPENIFERLVGLSEKSAIKIAFEKTNNNQLQAAALLGINRNTLHTKMKKFKLGDKK
jgi:DNA-binding protein Fis